MRNYKRRTVLAENGLTPGEIILWEEQRHQAIRRVMIEETERFMAAEAELQSVSIPQWQPPPPVASSGDPWRGIVIGAGFVGLIFLAWQLIGALSPDALAMALGICLGVLAAVPMTLLMLAAGRRDSGC